MWQDNKQELTKEYRVIKAVCDFLSNTMQDDSDYTGKITLNFFKGGLANINKEQSFKLDIKS